MFHPRVKYRISTKVGSTEVVTIDDWIDFWSVAEFIE